MAWLNTTHGASKMEIKPQVDQYMIAGPYKVEHYRYYFS